MAAVNPVRPLADTASTSYQTGVSALRKVSLRLLPLLALGYGAAFVDRVNISFASLQMNRDLHFSASMYGFGAGLFFLSYAASEIPSNLLLYRFGAKRWLARIMLTWGLLAIGMMFVRTPLQFYVVRFLLGMAEAGYFPGVAFYLMQWFPADMRARAISRFYVAVPLSSVFMGVLAGALLKLQGTLGLAGWQWLFLIEGLPPVLLSIAFMLYLPNHPGEAKWLTSEEREWLAARREKDAAEGAHDAHVSRALRDPRIWQLGVLSFSMLICAYAYQFSAPAILQKVTGMSIINVGFLTAIISLLSAAGMVVNARHSDRTKERHLHIAIPLLLMMVSFLISGLGISPLWTVSALTLASICYFSIQGVFWVIPPTFLEGKCAAAGFAAINTVAIIGGFIGPYWMGLMKDLTGSYQPGLITLVLPALAGVVITLVMRRGALRTA